MGHHSCLLFNFLDHIALWIVVVAFAFALFMPAFIISTTAGKQELEKGQARDVGETHASHVLTLYRGSFRPPRCHPDWSSAFIDALLLLQPRSPLRAFPFFWLGFDCEDKLAQCDFDSLACVLTPYFALPPYGTTNLLWLLLTKYFVDGSACALAPSFALAIMWDITVASCLTFWIT